MPLWLTAWDYMPIKTELEDLSMKYEHPEEYEVIDKKIEAYEKQFSGTL